MKDTQKAILIIMDGWGIGQKADNNAIYKADTPFVDSLYQNYPNAILVTYGEAVGLPKGQMGNSEVGHLNIGAGRVVDQELHKINKALENDRFLDSNSSIQDTISYLNETGKAIHFMGLVSDGGVHSHIDHLIRLVHYFDKKTKVPIFIDAFTDGRDTDPKSGVGFMQSLMEAIKDTRAEIATVTGRYYAMDRDKRWERVALAYHAMTLNEGEASSNILATMQHRYELDETDEFLKPIIHTNSDGQPIAKLGEGDVAFSFNFRTDRCREIVQMLSQSDFDEYNTSTMKDLKMVTMTEYSQEFKNVQIVFESEDIVNTLGEVIDNSGLWQIRIAETEKYPHVTFFFSGGREVKFERENRILLDSPRDVPTYDFKPEMSAYDIRDAILPEIERAHADLIVLNFANTDMVGHTGVFEAAMKAAETVDQCMSEIVPKALENDYFLVIIADHGNSDYMINPDGTPNTAHTMNPVPIFIVSNEKDLQVRDGKLADIAPTILNMMGLETPIQMTGDVLVSQKS